jgi:ornithine carbamoyltransferase
MKPRHFLTLNDLGKQTLGELVQRAIELKTLHKAGKEYTPLRFKTMAMIFEKSSTRTRVSFEAGMVQLGGATLFLSPRDTHLDRGERIEDTARVMSRMVDVIVIRAQDHELLERFASHSTVPVINALTDLHHPCQLLADMQTYVELRGTIAGRKAVWIGDGNNVCHSWIQAAKLFDFQLKVASPKSYQPRADAVAEFPDHVIVTEDPVSAVQDADIVVTDTWASMGQEGEKDERIKAFERYRVDINLLQRAKKDAVFMHCLPAYRGHEVTAEVIDGPQSVVWEEAENRLHAQKALLELLLVKN